MSLSANKSARTTQTLILFKMASIPTTEDLRYALSRACGAGKSVELPFRNPETGIDFRIRVIAGTPHRGPMWTMYQDGESGSSQLWNKECHEVIIIQGQLRLYAARARSNEAEERVVSENCDKERPQARFHL